MSKDPAVLAHQEWLGYVQPSGLVVSVPALLEANARINRNFAPEHLRFVAALPSDREGNPIPEIGSFPAFARAVLDWQPEDLYGSPGTPPLPDSLEAPLPEYGETLRPSYALREFQPKDPARDWILLVQELPGETDFDTVAQMESRQWQATPQTRFERLLRQTHVPVGLLVNQRQIRLVYAPEKELSGYLTFAISDMIQVAGRPILAAMQMLLSAERLYSVGDRERLPAILTNSRKYQNVVSTQLAGQVLEALYELLRGFQAADHQAKGELLREVLARDPDHVYRGLLTTLLRLVFVLYAEDRGLLSTDPVYVNYYSVTGLYERLRADAGRFPDTMDQRYGAWAQLLVLFRLIYSGGSHAGMRIPSREGYLFDPDRYLFLEGRQKRDDTASIPRVSDGVLYGVLSKLLLLDGERLSYRTLAVEQIGSVYEAIMGFELHVAAGPSIAIKPAKKHGAPATINLDELLKTQPDKRQKWFADQTDQKLTGQALDGLKSARSLDELLAALDRKIARSVTPNPVPKGAMIFQPSDERRRSGSHYTPSTLTGPIVQATLAPVLKRLGPQPRPDQILRLKVCDPAMGSGAFLVEACRQLGDALVTAWHAHGEMPVLPPDEDEALYAQRQIAQRCLYGVDKNPMAADLAKLSLWLATLAKDHPFTFLDHTLRPGDSLVGLTRQQIAAFHWAPSGGAAIVGDALKKRIERASEYRQRILSARDDTPYTQLRQQLDLADDALSLPCEIGDAAVAVFFGNAKAASRERARKEVRVQVETILKGAVTEELPSPPKGVQPFHWELEFPEVFANENGGFDAIVGNPPFAGKNTLIAGTADGYLEWLKTTHPESHGNSDLVAHFFRRAFTVLKAGGCFGLIAKTIIAKGDTRTTGLRWICKNGGTIYRAVKRIDWPGEAAVLVSVVHVCKESITGPYLLDGREVPIVTAYLFHAGGHDDPAVLAANESKSFQGSIVLGMGFTFDDTDTKGVATPITEMERLIAKDPRNKERIFPYIGGEELNDSPTHAHHRYVIDFGDMTEQDARQWSDLMAIVEQKVKPDRLKDNRDNYRRFWWQFAERRPGLARATRNAARILARSRIGTHCSYTFLPATAVVTDKVVAFALSSDGAFALLQARVHEVWARFFGTPMEDRLVYTPTLCFETFPFPRDFESKTLDEIGQAYYKLRAQILQQRNKGLTATYNEFHNPDSEWPEIAELRELHDRMDRTVLDAYDWSDIQPKCEFIPEFEDDEEEENVRSRRKKYRYRWPDDVRDEVLARLLDLNRQRALEEGQLTHQTSESQTLFATNAGASE